MRNLLLSAMAVCAVTLVVLSGCSETTTPPVIDPVEVDVLASKPGSPPGQDKNPPKDDPGDPSTGELCWYISAPKTGDVREKQDFVVYRFKDGEGLYTGLVFDIPLTLWTDEENWSGPAVGDGYMISAVEQDGHRYNMYHKVFINPAWEHERHVAACSSGDCGTGTVFARDWVRCRSLPCDVQTLGVNFVPGTGEGLLADFSGNINNNGTVYPAPLHVHTWPHGRICVPLPLDN
jgi:hypothetical protein